MPLRLRMMHGTFHIFWTNAVIQVACIVSWTSLFTCQMIVFTYFLSASLNGLAQIKQFVTLLYSLGYSWVSRFIGTLLAKCFLEMVAVTKIWYKKLFIGAIPYIYLECFKVLSITAFHVDAASTWYVMLVLGGEGFWWWWHTRVLFTLNSFEICVHDKS